MATYNDANVPYGSAVITIGGVGFVAESITITEPSTTIEVRNQIGEPSGQVTIPGFITGSTPLQFPTTAQVAPTIGATFLYAANGATSTTYYVSEVGQPVTQMDIKKAQLSFRKRLN
jgi:hypothetical protein